MNWSSFSRHYRERLEHQYNPRSWLRKVEGKTSTATNFGVELRYASASEAQHNGNIGEMLWLKDGNWDGFRLKYDGVNRLTEAVNMNPTSGIWEKVTEYDKNGNLKRLQRGKAGETWDNLEYFLSDNRLASINDAGNANGVKNGSSAYNHDDGGNLTSDGNKGATIAYNRLNLPRSVSIGSKTLGYSYDGNGNKLRMANGAVNTKYAGLFEYDEGNRAAFRYLTRITTEEGQIVVSGNGNTYTPNYYHKDHLGNVRAVINKEGTILQETEYFPFGLEVPKIGNDAVNKYQFLNREKQPETGYIELNRRFYDPTIGRFMQVDPVTETQENYSTYQYGWNNPILRSDPSGECPDCPDIDPFLTAKLMATALFDVKHAIFNTGARLLGSNLRAGYKTENGQQVLQTEISRGATGNILQEAIGTVADIATVATAGTNPVNPGNLLSKTSSTQVIRAGKEAVEEGVKAIHANSKASDKVNTLYRLETREGEYLKTGITSKAVPEKRYSGTFMADKQMVPIDKGTRANMLQKERAIVEKDPGPLNREPWAGKKREDP